MILLGGCGASGPEQDYRQYLTRLARTLAVAPVEPGYTPTPVLPPSRDLRLELPPGNIGALDFLALSGCEVQITIGKRNSSLGRMARPSQRLLLDLEFLQLAPACIAYQRREGEEALAATLEEAWELKREQLPSQVFNATLGSSEYRAFWRAPAQATDYPANTGSALITAMEALNGHVRLWLEGDFAADNHDIELLLGKVASGDGGALLRALAAQEGALAAADQILAARMAKGPLCGPGRRPAEADILDNVVRKFFIGAIQPRAAALNRRYHALLPALTELEEMLEPALPGAYQAWRSQRDQQLVALAEAPRRHVQALLAIQAPCNGGPAGGGR